MKVSYCAENEIPTRRGFVLSHRAQQVVARLKKLPLNQTIVFSSRDTPKEEMVKFVKMVRYLCKSRHLSSHERKYRIVEREGSLYVTPKPKAPLSDEWPSSSNDEDRGVVP